MNFGVAMARIVLSDAMWEKLQPLLPKNPQGGRPGKDDRLFIEAVCWIYRTGAPWRDLPPEFGPWNTVYNRFHRWNSKGHMEKIFDALKKRWQSRMAHD